jgi:hypothetical protein
VKNKHVALRFGVAFAVLIALLAGIGQLGLHKMHDINETLHNITGRRSAKLAQEALMLSNQNSRITMEVFLVQDVRASTGCWLRDLRTPIRFRN